MNKATDMQLTMPGAAKIRQPPTDRSGASCRSRARRRSCCSTALTRAKPRPGDRPDMGTLLGIDTGNTVVLAIVSALSVPVPAQRDGEAEIWIAELGLVGELWRDDSGRHSVFARGVTTYPSLGDRVRVASKAELEVGLLRRPATLGAHRLHPPGQLDPRHGSRRRAARQAFRGARNHGHRQVLHHGADPALDPRQEPGRAHRPARSPQRVRDRLRRLGRGH